MQPLQTTSNFESSSSSYLHYLNVFFSDQLTFLAILCRDSVTVNTRFAEAKTYHCPLYWPFSLFVHFGDEKWSKFRDFDIRI